MIISENFAKKAEALRPKLTHKKCLPLNEVEFFENKGAYHNLAIKKLRDITFPITLKKGESITLDFGDHVVGYLNLSLNNTPSRIADSPTCLKFSFGEFPLEIVKGEDEYIGTLGRGWLQREVKSLCFLPTNIALERRYSFRYLKIERVDNASFTINITDIFADAVTSADQEKSEGIIINDKRLKDIYALSLKTLKECEQDVFEDGPKRDRRLWIGDLRLQAICDYLSFKNLDLVKRCIYLFAAYRNQNGLVAPCVFPDSPPYIDGWCFMDYSLYFVSLLYDYTVFTEDITLLKEMFFIAKQQIDTVYNLYEKDTAECVSQFFIDWCEDLSKDVAAVGLFLYILRQFKYLCEKMGVDFGEYAVMQAKLCKKLRGFYSEKEGLFVSGTGQISCHSQIWAVLSGELSAEESKRLLIKTALLQTEYKMKTPYMMHYYLEALHFAKEDRKLLDFIKQYWGDICDFGFDCCPEIFNKKNTFESPYNAPEINTACHAWGCTPIYWINKLNK